MRRRRRSKGDIIVDITSLLDVVFIILMVVLCYQSSFSDDLAAREAEAVSAEAKAEDARRLYNEQMDTADSLNQYVMTASIIVPYDKETLYKREIKVLREGSEINSFELVGKDTGDAMNNFTDYLRTFISENKGVPVILSLNEDRDEILYRDEVAVNDILSSLSSEYDNVYIKFTSSEDAP